MIWQNWTSNPVVEYRLDINLRRDEMLVTHVYINLVFRMQAEREPANLPSRQNGYTKKEIKPIYFLGRQYW